jgi:putative transposase
MDKNIVSAFEELENKVNDPLTELLRQGAYQLIMGSVEAELQTLLAEHANKTFDGGKPAVVRNGRLPERTIQTGLGDLKVRVPKVRDRSKSGIKFNSILLPPYLKRTKSIEELIPWLYLKGISTGDYQEALSALLGKHAKGLSANTVSRLKAKWQKEHSQWQKRDLSKKNYVYIWADGIYSRVRMDNSLCLLVIIGVTDDGRKELIAVDDGVRESEQSWYEVLADLQHRGLSVSPKLAVADGALGFWAALTKIWPDCRQQRCWVHKTANVMNKLPKTVQKKVKVALHDIWMADSRENADKAFDKTLKIYQDKYPKAMRCLEKDRAEMLEFYNFPAIHWIHIRTTNPIESTFATVRLRTKRSRNCGSRETTLAMVFKLLESAQKRWSRIKGFDRLAEVIRGVEFINGESAKDRENKVAA